MSKGRHIHKGKAPTYEEVWAEYQAAIAELEATKSLGARKRLAAASDALLDHQGYGS
jgi:hypothetical protein